MPDLLAAAEKRAWVSLDPDLLRSVSSLTPGDFPAPAAGHLVVSLRVVPLLELAEESLEPACDSSAPGAAVPGPAAVREANRQYLGLFFHYARQLESVSLGINLVGNGAKLEGILRAPPGSPLAEFLSAQKKGELSLFGYLDPDLRGRLDQIAAGKSSFDTSRLGPRREEVNGMIYFSLNRFLENFFKPLWENMEAGEEAGIDPGLLTALTDLDLPMIVYLTIENRELQAATEIPGERIRVVKAAIETLEAGK